MGAALGITDVYQAFLHHQLENKRMDNEHDRALAIAGLDAIKVTSPAAIQAAEKILVAVCELSRVASESNNKLIESIINNITKLEENIVRVTFIVLLLWLIMFFICPLTSL